MVKTTVKNFKNKNTSSSDTFEEDPDLESLLICNGSNSRLSLAKKKSLLLPIEPEEYIGDLENDDEKEKRARREEAEALEKKKKEEQKHDKGSTARPTPFSGLSNLSKAELEEHYSRCIQLCNQNKVNSKNAFKLQLIDYMKLIFMNQSKKTENLSLMSCTLDASAKIYSYRVDKVYSDMMKVMSGKDWTKEKDDTDTTSDSESKEDQPDDEDNDECPVKKRKMTDDDDNALRLDLEKMLCNENQLKGDADGESIYKDRTTLPKHMEYFYECSLSDPDGALILNEPVFVSLEDNSSNNLINLGPRYYGNFNTTDAATVFQSYNEMHKCFHVIGESTDSAVVNKSLVYDASDTDFTSDAMRHESYDNDINVNAEEPEFIGDYDDCFSEEEVELDPLNPTKLSEANPVPKAPLFSIQAMSKLVSINSDDYTFFDNGKLSFWKGPSHWSIKPVKRKLLKLNETKKGVKKTFCIDFSMDNVSEIKKEYSEKINVTLAKKTLKTWSKMKCKDPEDIRYTQRQMLSLFHNERLLYINKDFTSSGIYSTCVEEDEAQAEVMSMPMKLSTKEELDGDDNDMDIGMDHCDDMDELPASPIIEDSIQPETSFSGIELIPAPQKVNKICINYAKTQKKIDMKLLKATIWKLLALDSSSEENNPDVGREENRVTTKKLDKVNFSDVYKNLFKELPKEEASALSFPIAFMALLHLANEKVLQVNNNESFEDLTVQMAVPPSIP